MTNKGDSIFRRYYSDEPFVDRFLTESDKAIDVIIPLLHTNELWEKNLISFYREIPIHKLLLGDGGVIDDSIKVAMKFPRVTVFDHRKYLTLGYSLRRLIEAVETNWFAYLHSDIYLPSGWFDTMRCYQREYDWFGCPMQHTIMVEYHLREKDRPYAGSQMGRKKVFEKNLTRIDDDYVYRQEDFVLADIVERGGGKVGKVEDTFHYNQTMHKPSSWMRKVRSATLDVEMSREEKVRTWMMQSKGIIKYLEPNHPWLINDVRESIRHLDFLKELDWADFKNWTRETNSRWLPYLSRERPLKERLQNFLSATYHLIFG